MPKPSTDSFEILQSRNETLPYVARVQAMADSAKTELGFLPASAYHDHATRDRLWVMKDTNDDVAGYLLFGGRFPQLKVFQLHVREDLRGQGIGQRLVDKLIDFGGKHNYQYISARVASELPANQFWQNVGFQLVDQLYQSEPRRTLNVYYFEFSVNSLFNTSDRSDVNYEYTNQTQLRNRTFALDLNIFFDVAKNRVHSDDARRILGLAMGSQVQIAVTNEFATELKRSEVEGKPDPILKFASSIPTLPDIPDETTSVLVQEIRPIVFPTRSPSGRTTIQDDSDLKHLAICIHHGISGFVTRDRALLSAADDLRKRYEFDVIAPWEFVDFDSPSPVLNHDFVGDELQGTLVVAQMEESSRAEISKFLSSIGVTAGDLLSQLSPGDSINAKTRVVAIHNSKPIGYLSYTTVGINRSVNANIYIDEGSKNSESIIDQFVQLLENSLPVSRFSHVSVESLKKQFSTNETLRAKGFLPSPASLGYSAQARFEKCYFTGPVLRGKWDDFSKDYEQASGIRLPATMPTFSELTNTGLFVTNVSSRSKFPMKLREFETMTSSFLIAEGRPILIVPIRLGYANRLLGTTNKQQYLTLPSSEALMVSERAYFSSVGASKKFTPGAILLFYVSQAGGGNQALVGMARTTLAKKMSVDSARTALKRQGVLDEDDLERIGNKRGELFAVTFDTYIKFPSEVSYRQMKQLGSVGPANLVTAQPISDTVFTNLASIAFGLS